MMIKIIDAEDKKLIGLEVLVETKYTIEELNNPMLVKEYNESNGNLDLLQDVDIKTDIPAWQKHRIKKEVGNGVLNFEHASKTFLIK